MEEEGGSSGKITTDHYAREVLPGFTYRAQRSTGSKENRANPFSAAAERKKCFIVEGDWINAFWMKLKFFQKASMMIKLMSAAMARLF